MARIRKQSTRETLTGKTRTREISIRETSIREISTKETSTQETSTKKELVSSKKIWHIALYIRLSHEDGNDESLSVSNQRKILMEFLEQSFQGDYILEDSYIDDGQSGTDYERPDFLRMIHDVETGVVNCILCKNLSRAFRNYSDQGYFLESFFPRFRTRFITLGDPKIDTFLYPEAVSGMEIPINGLMNDRFAYKTSSDIRRTFDTKRRKGEFIGAFAPYGYRKDPKDKNRLLIDTEAAQVVNDIFVWYVYGDGGAESLSKEGIARKLNALGILNPTAYKRKNGMKYNNPQMNQNDGLWQGSSITAILSNEMYIGTMVQGKQRVISYKVHDKVTVPQTDWYRVPNTHEPIIENALFETAQKMQEKDMRRAPKKSKHYLFSGFLRCADCKKAMTRKPSKQRIYYNCSTYKRKSKTKCTIHSIRLDVLEEAVLLTIQTQIALLVDTASIIDKVKKGSVVSNKSTNKFANKSAKIETSLKSRTQELEKVESLAADLYIDWKEGEITHEQYRMLKERFEKQMEQLKKVISHIEETRGGSGEEGDTESSHFVAFCKHKNIQTLTQGLLIELVKDIFVHEGGGITIVFRFADEYRRRAERMGSCRIH